MSVESMAEDRANKQSAADRHDELAERLEPLETVRQVSVHDERTPTRVRLVLDVANMPNAVSDLLERFGAQIVPESVEVQSDGVLAFDLTTPEGFLPAGVRDARAYGESSVSITFTRESLDLSGFDVGDSLEVRAREGAVLLTPHGT